LDLCNGTAKKGCIPTDWKSSVVLPIYNGKGDPIQRNEIVGTRYESHGKNLRTQNSAADIDDMQ